MIESKSYILTSDYKERYFTNEERIARINRLAYSQNHLSSQHSILWTVNVLSDGWGDLFNCLNAVRLTKQEYPDWVMKVFITLGRRELPFNLEKYGLSSEDCLVIPYGDQNATNKLKPGKERTLLLMKTDEINLKLKQVRKEYEQLKKDLPLLAQKIDEFINFAKTADLQISVSTLNMTSLSDINYKDSKFVYFEEYGGSGNCLVASKNTFMMGVASTSCGIYILDPEIPEQFINPVLHKYFNEKDKVYFNYGWDIQGYTSLVNRLNPDALELNIITNASPNTIAEMHFEGVQNVTFVDERGLETDLAQFKTSGKTLRFINPFPLEHNDMIRAIALSQEPVGITGNNTFSESLSRLPFYNNRDCLAPFWQQLIHLAEQATPQNSELIEYLKQMSYTKDEKGQKNSDVFVQSENLPILKEQWSQLVAILQQDWDVKDTYLSEINRRMQSLEISAFSK